MLWFIVPDGAHGKQCQSWKRSGYWAETESVKKQWRWKESSRRDQQQLMPRVFQTSSESRERNGEFERARDLIERSKREKIWRVREIGLSGKGFYMWGKVIRCSASVRLAASYRNLHWFYPSCPWLFSFSFFIIIIM